MTEEGRDRSEAWTAGQKGVKKVCLRKGGSGEGASPISRAANLIFQGCPEHPITRIPGLGTSFGGASFRSWSILSQAACPRGACREPSRGRLLHICTAHILAGRAVACLVAGGIRSTGT